MQQALTAALVDKCLKITEKEVRNHLRNVCVKKIGILFPELDEDVRTKTADYALIQVASERDRADMIKNLQSILGPYTANFVDWLMVIIRTLSRKTAEVKFDVVHSDVKDHVKKLGVELSDASAARKHANTREEAVYKKNQGDTNGSLRRTNSTNSAVGRVSNRERDQMHLDSEAPAVVAARRHLIGTDHNAKAGLQRRNSGGGKEGKKVDGFAVPFSPRLAGNSRKLPAPDEAALPTSTGSSQPQRRRRHSASPRDSTLPRDASPTGEKFPGKVPLDDFAGNNDVGRQDRYGGPRRRHSISPTPMIDRTHDYEYYKDISYGRDRDRRDYDRRRNEDRGGYGGGEDRGPFSRPFPRNDAFSNNSRYEGGGSRYADSSSNQRYGGRRRHNSLDREWTPYQRRWSPSFEAPPRSYYSRMYQEKMRNDNYYRRGNSPLHVVEYRSDRRGRGVFDYLPTRDVHAHSKHIISQENKNKIRSVIGCVIGASSSVTTTSAADTTTSAGGGGDATMDSVQKSLSSNDVFKRPADMPSVYSRLGSKPQRPPQNGGYPRYDEEMLPYSRRNARNPSEVSQVDSLYGRLAIKPEKIRITLRQNYMSRDGPSDRYEMGGYYGDEPMRRYEDGYDQPFEPPPPQRYYDEDVMMMPPPSFAPPVPVVRGEQFYTDDELLRRATNSARSADDTDDQRTQISRSSRKTANTSVSKRPVSSVEDSPHAHHCCSCAHTPQHTGGDSSTPIHQHKSPSKHVHPQHSPINSVNGADDDDDIISMHSVKRSSAAASISGRRSTKAAPSIAAASTVSKRRRTENNEPVSADQNTQAESVRHKKKSTAASVRSQRLSLSPMSVDIQADDAVSQFEPVSPLHNNGTQKMPSSSRQNASSSSKLNRTKRSAQNVVHNQTIAEEEPGDVIYLQDFSENDVEELNRHSMLPHSYDAVSPPNEHFNVFDQFAQPQQQRGNGTKLRASRNVNNNLDVQARNFQQQQQQPILQQFDENLLYNLDSGMSGGESLSPPPAPPQYVRQQQRRRQQNMAMLDSVGNYPNNNMLIDMPEEISLDIPRALSPEARERIIAARNRELALFELRQLEQQQQLSSFAGSDYDILQDDLNVGMHSVSEQSVNNNMYAGNRIANPMQNNFSSSAIGLPQQQRPMPRSMPPANNKAMSVIQGRNMPQRGAVAAVRQQRQSQPPQNRSTYFAPALASSSNSFVEGQQQLRPAMPYGAAKSNKYSYAASAVSAPIRRAGSVRNPYTSTFAAHSSTKYISNKKLDVLDVGRIIANAAVQQQPQQQRTVSGFTTGGRASADPYRPKSATAAVVAASAAAAESAAKPVITKLDSRKLSRLCPWWPLCNRGNYCNNLHPKVSRRCQFGTYCNARSGNCCYQHPHCYFGSQGTCSNLQCPFDHGSANCTEAELELFKKHVAEKPDDAHVVQSPYPPPTTYTRVDWLTDADRELLPEICIMWLRNKCANAQCPQMHRTKQGCMFHPQCVKRLNNDCPYLHPDEVERFLPINNGGAALAEPASSVAVADVMQPAAVETVSEAAPVLMT